QEKSDVAGVTTRPIGPELHREQRLLRRDLDGDPVLVVDRLPFDCTAECGQRVGARDLEVQPGRIPVVALGYLSRGSGDRGVAPRSDVNRVEVLCDSTVEIAER